MVTLANLEEYIERVTQVFLVDGVQQQFNAFVKGFNAILSVEHLRVFTVNELSTLLCGVDETANDMWTKNSKSTLLVKYYNVANLLYQPCWKILSLNTVTITHLVLSDS